MPRLSVLLPVRNGQATIGTAVTTTLRAMPRDSELVVFDDASTDATLAELDRIDDSRLAIVAGTEPMGVSGGLNRLLRATDSELVARMDADDVCLPWRFRQQLGALRTGRRVHAVFSTVVNWHSGQRRLVPNPPIGISPAAFPVHLTMTNPVSHPTMLASRGVIMEVGGYHSVPAEDYELWMRVHLAGFRLRRLAMPCLAYRVHGGQVTATDGWSAMSWANPVVAAAYSDLTADVLGTRFVRLNVIATSPEVDSEAFENLLEQFSDAIRRASARLGPERQFVLRVLKRRMADVRALRKRSVTSPAA